MHHLHIYNGKLNANTEKYNFLFFLFSFIYNRIHVLVNRNYDNCRNYI